MTRPEAAADSEKATFLFPDVVPYSSRVGSGIIVREGGPTGPTICQLMLLNVGVEEGQQHREQSEAVAELIADALREWLPYCADAMRGRTLRSAAPAMYEALKAAEELYRIGVLAASDELVQRVHSQRRAALASVEAQP